MSELIPKRYLGDGVYAAVEHGMIKLTTEDGLSVTNTIFLEPEVFSALALFYVEASEAAERLAHAHPDSGSADET